MIYGRTQKVKRVVGILSVALFAFTIAAPAAGAATIVASVKPTFQADLTTTLKLQAGTGLPTFTRATTATVVDWEGLVRTVLSGEARFTGARRVANLVQGSSEDFTNANWLASSVTITKNAATSPHGDSTASSVYPNSTGTFKGPTQSLHNVGTGVYTVSVYAKANGISWMFFRNAAGSNVGASFNLSNGTVGTVASNLSAAIQAVGNGWYRVTMTTTVDVPGMQFNIGLADGDNTSTVTANGASGILLWGAQDEFQAGQSNKAVSEYVSRGVLPAPYEGAGVDGVQYFNTLNGNTVASNVVTAGTGLKINSTTAPAGYAAGAVDASGPLGYLAEGSRTNLALYSGDFSNIAWTKSGTSIGGSVQLLNGSVGTVNKLIEDTSGGTSHIVRGTVATVAATTYTLSVFLKQAERRYVLVGQDASGTGYFEVDLQNGVFTAVTSGTYLSRSISSVGNGWYRVSITYNAPGVSASGIVFLEAASNSYAYTGDGSSGVYAWGAQLEAGAFASSYIPTTSASVTRNADVLTYPSSKNFSNAVGTFYVDFLPTSIGDMNNTAILGDSNTAMAMISAANQAGKSWDGTQGVSVNTTGLANQGTLVRDAFAWSGSSQTGYSQGRSNSTAYDGSWNFSSLKIGNTTTGTTPQIYFGTIRNIKIWPKILTNTQLTTMTAPNTPTSIAKSVVPQTTIKTPTGTGLVAHWTFDEGTGTKANDASGLGNSGTLVGSPTWTTGKLGKALSFNGTSSYVDTSLVPTIGAGNVSYSAWFKTSTSQQGGILSTRSSGSGIAQFSIVMAGDTAGNPGTKILGYGWDGTTIRATLSPLSYANGTWHHAVLVHTAAADTLYVDGVSVNSVSSAAQNIAISTHLFIGAHESGSVPLAGWYFNGSVDEVRIYNRALSAAEITALYKSGAAVVNASTNTAGGSLTSGLVGLWSFDGKDMNWATGTALDRSGQGNNGTLTNMSQSTSPTIGKIGQALNFNWSSNNYIDIGPSVLNNLSQGTVAIWFKVSQLAASSQYIVAALTQANDEFGLRVNANGSMWQTVNNGCDVGNTGIGAGSIAAGQWYQVVVTWDTNGKKIYLNNSLKTTVSQSCVSSPGSRNNTLGKGWDSGSITGAMDDVRIYNRALSATEVKALYNLGR